MKSVRRVLFVSIILLAYIWISGAVLAATPDGGGEAGMEMGAGAPWEEIKSVPCDGEEHAINQPITVPAGEKIIFDCCGDIYFPAAPGVGTVGMSVTNRKDIIIRNCNFNGFGTGISVQGGENIVLQSLKVIDSMAPTSAGILLVPAPSIINVSIEKSLIKGNNLNTGILLNCMQVAGLFKDVTVSGNTIKDNVGGISAMCVNNKNLRILENSISDNSISGIYMAYNLDSNAIFANNTLNSNGIGISLNEASGAKIYYNELTGHNKNFASINIYNSPYNAIFSNLVRNNKAGIYVAGKSGGNRIYDNYLENQINGADNNTAVIKNYWSYYDKAANEILVGRANIIGGDDTGGNYWSNYKGADVNKDGFGDTPYTVAPSKYVDKYPLVYPVAQAPPVVPAAAQAPPVLSIPPTIPTSAPLIPTTPSNRTTAAPVDTSLLDDDNDGVTIGDGDCDDDNAFIYPGAKETCSATEDYDCDGLFGEEDEDCQGLSIWVWILIGAGCITIISVAALAAYQYKNSPKSGVEEELARYEKQ